MVALRSDKVLLVLTFLVGLFAIFILITPLFENNVRGLAVEPPEYYDETTGILTTANPELVDFDGREVLLELLSLEEILIDGQSHTLGNGVLLDVAHYFEVSSSSTEENPDGQISYSVQYRIIHPKFASTCSDLTQETFVSTAGNAVCCTGVLTALPVCPSEESVTCGDRVIQCNGDRLESSIEVDS